tara:strand:+ start:127 stop:633 length:507 start_codon:yes stop_codon:yes gene_type:complete
MRKYLYAVLLSIAGCHPVNAAEMLATITNIQPNYYFEQSNVPVETCKDIQVPIYGSVQGEGASGGDVLGGAIIGGLLGQALTGKDNGAAFGAIVGAMGAAENKKQSKQKIVGYQTQRQCGVFYQQESIRKIKNYKITYEWMGIVGSSYTYNNYSIGSHIPINVTINAK